MILNKEFQEVLKKYGDDLPVAIEVNFNGTKQFFTEFTVMGVKVHDLKLVIVNSADLDEDYETLLNGADIDELKE